MSTKMSYTHVPHTAPMEARCLHQFLDSVAERRPDDEALIMYDMDKTPSVMTFMEYKNRSMLLASSLLDLGLSRGHRVLLIGASSIRFAVSIMALHRTGANVILLGPGGLTDDKVKVLKTLNLKMIIFDPAMKESQMEQLKKGLADLVRDMPDVKPDQPLFITLGDQESSQCVYNEGQFHTYGSLLHHGAEAQDAGFEKLHQAQEQIQLDDPCVVFFITSGSTGTPKLVQCTMHQYSSYLLPMSTMINEKMHTNSSQQKMYHDRPMVWMGGWFGILRIIGTGITVVWVPTELALSDETNETVFEIIAKEKCDSVPLAENLINKLTSQNLQLKYDLSNLSSFFIAGQRYPLALVEAVFKCLPSVTSLLHYGSTECGVVGMETYTKEQLTEEDYAKMPLFPGNEVKIVDAEDKLVPIGKAGEICVRSHYVLLEYLGNPVATKQVKTPTGWYHMGDVGKMDDKGRIEVIGRTKEIIKRAAVKIFPAEIESVLLKHPVVADAVVIGVPDQRLHEEICACVILTSGESANTEARLAELEAWCEQQWPPSADGLSLKPKYVVPMENFPWLGNVKIDRNGLQKVAIERLGL